MRIEKRNFVFTDTDSGILEEGLDLLSKNDSDAERLIEGRREDIRDLLLKYISLIEAHNPALGLVGTSDRRTLIIRHILDSLAPLGMFGRLLKNSASGRAADLGSGAGLPGIPLAAALPEADFTLIERMGRRAVFLRGAAAGLALSNVTVAEAEMEKFAHNVIVKKPSAPRPFSLVTFRAFRSFEPKIIKGLFRLCAAGGVIAAYKGSRKKTDEDISALKNYFQRLPDTSNLPQPEYEVIPCPTPLLDEQRHILLIRLR